VDLSSSSSCDLHSWQAPRWLVGAGKLLGLRQDTSLLPAAQVAGASGWHQAPCPWDRKGSVGAQVEDARGGFVSQQRDPELMKVSL
jgi:hypothetical protein